MTVSFSLKYLWLAVPALLMTAVGLTWFEYVPVEKQAEVSSASNTLIELPSGKLQALSIVWDSRTKEQGGQRWFHQIPNSPQRNKS